MSSLTVMEEVGRTSLEDRALGLIHQFGKDLCWIRSMAHKLRALQVPSGVEVHAQRIEDIAEEMAESARHLLDEVQGGSPAAGIKLPLAYAVRDAIRRARRNHPDARIEFDTTTDSSSAFVPHLLRDVLLDVLDNAARATAVAGVVRVSVSTSKGFAIRVEDSGVGMDAATRAACTDRGFSTRAGEGGHGVGLATSRAILESLGGHLEIESELGRGTVVVLRLLER